MHRSLQLSLSLTGAAALALASAPFLPLAAQENGSTTYLSASLCLLPTHNQQGDLDHSDGSGIKGRLASSGHECGRLSKPEAFLFMIF